MVIAVTGGRRWVESERRAVFLWNQLGKFLTPSDVLIVGGDTLAGDQRGVDAHAYNWGLRNGVHVAVVKPYWTRHGKKAGPLRNKAMIDLKPDLLLAFPGGAGTADTIEKAIAAGIKVVRLNLEAR